MGDSTAMTIEFLRARLLSERSVSRSARQMADQLAKRVLELEEQLRIVTIQRKKAEKAANEVLAILESQGINDFPEVIDSSSDRDNLADRSKGSDENAKGDETSSTSRMDRSDVEDGMSGSEVEVSPPQGRSLSWKSRNNSLNSSEKMKEYQTRQRQRRVFISRIESSSQHLLGKSCRRIKSGRDFGGASENGGSNGRQPGHTSDCADDEAQLPEETYDIEQEKLEENVLHSEGQNRGPVINLYGVEFGRDEAMEKALQQQAQLIVRYQAEENAQREWEEKYNENNSSALATCEQHEKLINTAEDNDEDTKLADETFSYHEETRTSNGISSVQDPVTHSGNGLPATDSDSPAIADVTTSDSCPLSVDVGGSGDQQCLGTVANEYGTGSQEFEFSGASSPYAETREKPCHEQFRGNTDISSCSNSKLQLCGNEFLGSMPTESPSSSRSSGKFSKGQLSLVQNQISRDLPKPPNNGLGNVLDALQHAKLSLRQELNRLQPPVMSAARSAWATTTDSQSLAIRSSDTSGVPFGSAGLFRLPTDLPPQVNLPRSNYYDTGLSMPALRSCSGFSDGYNPRTSTETRTAVTSTRQYLDRVPTRLDMPTFTGAYAYAATGLGAGTSYYGRLPDASYVGGGMKRETSGVDSHTIHRADRSHLNILGVHRFQE